MIIITGATGFVGRYLVHALVKKGEKVIACGRNNKYQDFFNNLNVELINFNVSDKLEFNKLQGKECKTFIHLAALIPSHANNKNNDQYFKVNTLGTFNAIDWCQRNNIKKFITTTTLYECINHKILPINESMGRNFSLTGDHALYVISKIAASDIVKYFSKENHIQSIILRFTGLLGFGREEGYWDNGKFYPSAFEVFYRNAKKGRPIEIWGEHAAQRDSLYVKDAVGAICKAIESQTANGLYNIGSGIGRTNEEEAKTFARVFGTNQKPIKLIYNPEKKEKSKSYYFDISKAKNELGWEPRFCYEKILRDYDFEAKSGQFSSKKN